MANTLKQLIEESQQYDLNKADFIAPAKLFNFDESARIVPPADGPFQSAPLNLTEKSLRDLCSKLSPAVYGKGAQKVLPFDYLDTLRAKYPALLSTVFNDHLRNANGNEWMVRAYQQDARAVMSGGYPGGRNVSGDFENTAYLRILDNFVGEMGGRLPDMHVARSNVSPDDLNTRIIWKDNGGGYGIGCAVINGETGTRKLKILPLIKRTSCDNSIIVNTGEDAACFVHRGSLDALKKLFIAALTQVLGASADALDKMLAAETEQVPDFEMVLAGLARKHGWNEDVKLAVATGTERETTRAAIVNGITWAAHTAVTEPNAQVEMEELGGYYLCAADSVFSQAAKAQRRELAGIER